MSIQRLLIVIVLGFLLRANYCADGESLTCLTVYREGGAPAVFRSPKCPRWSLSSFRSNHHSARCQSATHQGRRKSQEDRTLCALDIRIPFPDPAGIKVATVGIIAVFDGHNGAEASEMASKLLLEYFTLHTYFLLDSTFAILSGKSVGRLGNEAERGLGDLEQHIVDLGRFKLDMSTLWDGSLHLEILKEALLRAIHDVDVAFTMDAFRYNFDSGSTASVILIASNKILVANVGDSKAFLCSETHQSPREAKATLFRLYRENKRDRSSSAMKNYHNLKVAASNGLAFLIAKELTEDHHPDREDERTRVESAGGHVSEWAGVARVNGELAVSRAIGDVFFKSYGVVSLPEVNDWQSLSVNDSYLVTATDGVFEQLKPQEICDLFWELHIDRNLSLELPDSLLFSLADRVVDSAFTKGSMDNMAAVVLPLRTTDTYQTILESSCDESGELAFPALEYIKHFDEQLVTGGTSVPEELEQTYPLADKFEWLLVERKQNSLGCFYLSESLDEMDGYTFWIQKIEKNDEDYNSKIPHALPGAMNNTCGQLMNFHNDQSTCMFCGFGSEEYKGQSTNSEGFTWLLGLLGSIPLHNADLDEPITADSRYILKKRYGRGSYGEVWLAFQWNCSSVSFEQRCKENPRTMHAGACNGTNSRTSSSAEDPYDGVSYDNMFILKRIMVERGAAVYLSGLREKYFGEVFLNASSALRFSPSGAVPNYATIYQETETETSESSWTLDNILFRNENLLGSSHEEGLNHIARFVESFESRSNQIWLVFRHEGLSLSKILYSAEEVPNSADTQRDEHFKRIQILHPSNWWHRLKTTEAGHEEMRSLIFQLLMALKSCHDRNITHRDIKPENMVVCIEDQVSGRCLKEFPDGGKNYTAKMRLIDFGSAIDEFTVKKLYGSLGPSRAEQTTEYAPPEAFLNASWYMGPMHKNVKYDMWSVGVIILELILGSPDVFQISSKTRALLDRQLKGWNENVRELAYKLRSFMEMCILVPGVSTSFHHISDKRDYGSVPPVPWKCSEAFFFQQIKNRDPLKIGFPNILAMRLVRELLRWNPEDRLSVDEALSHPYFSLPSRGH